MGSDLRLVTFAKPFNDSVVAANPLSFDNSELEVIRS
jgi:hypothetical protein